MMPAWTGEPPGELIFRITPAALASAKAACSEALIASALAGVPAAISPSRVTMAVWRPAVIAPSGLKSNIATNRTTSTSRVDSRKKMRQRRAARCSRNVAISTRSSTSRSQPAPVLTGPAGSPCMRALRWADSRRAAVSASRSSASSG
ncbi:hypothetical protein L602_002500000780 [Cupriavidus gilardii J11]|uniref:Uncharacterized protein n=1 Tax=Cupriavidus gilardii J11 TaxID=936133 RepID=A0A562BJK2_9BURK|nr:hypothetical protein L602_002500000780 [Cupriavidus gilardii J11]